MDSGTGRTPGGGAGEVGARRADRLDHESFAREFQASFRVLWCIAAGVLGDRSRAADVVQDAAIVALRRLDDFQPGTSFLAWMGRIVRFTAINERRKTVRHRTSAAEPAVLDLTQPSRDLSEAGPLVDGRGQLLESGGTGVFDDRLLTALAGLAEPARACLLLRTVMDMPYREIAQALDIPEGTAMSHVHRARRALRVELGESAEHASGGGATGRGDGDGGVKGGVS